MEELPFEQAMAILRNLIPEPVEVSVWGLDNRDGAWVATIVGKSEVVELSSELPAEFRGAARAVVLRVGEGSSNYVSFWPDRFLRGRALEHPRGVEFVTMDGAVRVQTVGEPWVG
ncbi:MAG TPA: hypothetical protein VMT59_04165 [Gaiellaceae bacterium]|nr:hypothetical protein [Gaiellaceae bacterium]